MKVLTALKRVLVGQKLSSAQLGETLVPKRVALPILASDAMSSVAYAPEEILVVLSVAGVGGFAFSWQIGILVSLVMVVVVMSYRQTVYAYPEGGGDYEVARTNLGPNAALIVASALLVDYTLTVAVSVSSGILNASVIFGSLSQHKVLGATIVILILATMNLRGVREAGTLFAIPTYCFILGVFSMVGYGLFRILVLKEPLRAASAGYQIAGVPGEQLLAGFAMVALFARAFSSGAAALTGVEAIANGVPIFRKPKSKNAATVLAMLAVIAVSMFLGIIALARLTEVKVLDPSTGAYFLDAQGNKVHGAHQTVIGQLASTVFSDTFPIGLYFVIGATMVILFLAANTAFNGFPALGSILARDGLLPRQLYTRGDRLAFSNGIVALAVMAIALIWVVDASVTALIQFYVVGVFISFTVGQYGMLRHWTTVLKSETSEAVRRRVRWSRRVNAFGMTMTATVLVIVIVSKFTHGAYLSLIAMLILAILMRRISRHYKSVSAEVALDGHADRVLPSRVHAVVLVNELNKPTMKALAFAKASRPASLRAVTVAVDDDEAEKLIQAWRKEDIDVQLRVISSPYREITNPFINYVRELRSDNPRDVVSVFIPEYVVGHWWEHALHNQSALVIRVRLHFIRGVMVTSVPYQLKSSAAARKVVVRAGDARPYR